MIINDNIQAGPMGVELQSVGLGEWIRTGNREFSVTAVGQHYTLQGSPTVRYKARLKLTLERTEELTGFGRIEFFAPNGTVVFVGDPRLTATRLQVEPLD